MWQAPYWLRSLNLSYSVSNFHQRTLNARRPCPLRFAPLAVSGRRTAIRIQVPRAVDRRQMGERLREIAQLTVSRWIVQRSRRDV